VTRSGALHAGAVVAAVGVSLSYLWAAWHGFQLDLAVYRGGGHAAFDGHDLYSLAKADSAYFFTYPPLAALVFVPVAAIPQQWAQVLWTSAALIGLWCVVRLTLRRYASPNIAASRTWPWVVFVLVAISDPLRVGFGLGQINVFIALLLLADFAGALPRIPRGVLIGVAAAVKLTPLFLIAYLLVVRRTRAALWAAGAFTLLTVVALVVMPVASADYWWRGAASDFTRFGVGYVSNQSANGFIVRLLHYPDHARLWWLLLAVPAAVGVLWLARRVVADRPWLAEAVAMAGMLVISPISWIHHWILVLPLIVASFRLGAQPGHLACRWLTGALVAVLLTRVIWLVTFTYRDSPLHFLIGNIDVVLLVALLVVTGWQVAGAPRPGSRSRPATDAGPTS
jgi:alpha-1,2-mannosyltransferase